MIATLAYQEKSPTRIVTGDRDLFQLVDDKRDVAVAYLAKGISNHDLVNLKWISQKYDIPGERYALFAMIRGDASDGLPGIKGIGEKGAAEIARNFESIDSVVVAAKSEDSRLKEAHRKKILNDLGYAEIVEKLVLCADQVALPKVDFGIPRATFDESALMGLIEQYGLSTSFERLKAALQWP